MPLWGLFLLATLPAIVFFGLLELVLLLLGVRPIFYFDDPYVGFASHSPLYVEDVDESGREIMRTAENKRSSR